MIGFHLITLAPSKIPSGMRLKAAKILFIMKPNQIIFDIMNSEILLDYDLQMVLN